MRQDVDLSARMVDLMDKWAKCWLDMKLLGIHVEEYNGFVCHRKTEECWVHHLTPTRLDGLMVANWSIPKSATRPKPSCIHADRDPRTDLKTMEFRSTGQWTTNGPNQINKIPQISNGLSDWDHTETFFQELWRQFADHCAPPCDYSWLWQGAGPAGNRERSEKPQKLLRQLKHQTFHTKLDLGRSQVEPILC
jgi:hypothetical protein